MEVRKSTFFGNVCYDILFGTTLLPDINYNHVSLVKKGPSWGISISANVSNDELHLLREAVNKAVELIQENEDQNAR